MLNKIYNDLVLAGDIARSPLQEEALKSLDALSTALLSRRSLLPWKKSKSLKSLYIYGNVGAGKTFIMDLFYDTQPTTRKARFHFYQFMRYVDNALRTLQGKKDPLKIIAKTFAKSYDVLCLDEFLVEDIADAMILAELLEALFKTQIVIIFTSNTKPENLYLEGLNRQRFLPAIDLIQLHCELLVLSSYTDHRLGREPLMETYIYPITPASQKKFLNQFYYYEKEFHKSGTIFLQSREISYQYCGKSAIWFEFTTLCNLPRSSADYLELADRFDTVFLANIPVLQEKDTVYVLLLMHLVDIFYDKGMRLLILAETALENLYVNGCLIDEFKRTFSRLKEMQAKDYVARHPYIHHSK